MGFGTARRITANFASLLTSQIISRVLQLIIFAYLARMLGKEDFGIFSFAFAFGLLIAIIADFGLSSILVREISRDKKSASKYLSNALIIKVFLSIITIILSFLFLNIMGYSQEVKAVAYVMLGFALLQTFTELYYAIFRAFERMHYDAFIKLLRVLMLLAAIFYLIRNGFGLLESSFAFFAIEAIVLIVAFLITYTRFVKISFEFDYAFSRELMKSSSLFFFSMIFIGMYLYIDQIMISKMRGTTEVGLYSAAANIIIALIFIPQMYGNAIYPVFSRFYLTSKKMLKYAYERSFKYMFILGLPAASGIFVLSDSIILALYGEEYIASSIVLKILSGYIFLKFLNPLTGYTLISINKQGSRLFGQGTAALINILLNLILIPKYGIVGAASATLITEIIFLIIYKSFITKYGFTLGFVFKFIHKPVFATAVMVASLYLANRMVSTYFTGMISYLIAMIIFGMIIYSITLLTVRIIDKEDRYLIGKIIKSS